MRIGCATIFGMFLGFIGYGLFLSWGIDIVVVFVALVAMLGLILYYRLKNKNEEIPDTPKASNEEDKKERESPQLVLQDPDTLLQKFRMTHQEENGHLIERTPLHEDNEAFTKAVEELKKETYKDDSPRMQWINQLEKDTKKLVEKAQLKTNGPVMKRVNSIFILHGFLYIRVFVNLIDISIKMEQLDRMHTERLDQYLSSISKSEYERLNRVIALHYLDLFLSDHAVSVMFTDTFSRRSFTQSVMNGLGFGKQETLMLQAIETDTEYVQVLLEQLRMEKSKKLIDLAKTAFENTEAPLKEKIITELNSRAL
ncbi:hypothetical protein DCC39_15225 [Pueribacillus theae]|uniref:Uncharacterized protein n=1 Tax=Pueribacillus theae TaxID=2171751 RepID=A0A2U1JT43_9BACI|nr:hypothetical protein [Pueribacillus theae]PWA08282.1 hypothetical protein DCC39_15225 [Pueribacillus theae]